MLAVNFVTFVFLQTFILLWQPWKSGRYWCFWSTILISCQTKNI